MNTYKLSVAVTCLVGLHRICLRPSLIGVWRHQYMATEHCLKKIWYTHTHIVIIRKFIVRRIPPINI